MSKKTTIWVTGLVVVLMAGCVPAAEKEMQSSVVLLKKIDAKDLGAWGSLRLGDLDGDGQLDIVHARHRGQMLTCIAAVDINGKLLWQVGKAGSGTHKISSDLPMQIYDIDLDGENEVLCVMDGKLKILSGKDGTVERQAPLPSPDAHDCIIIANLSGNKHPREILIKDRYKNIWALDKDLKVLWKHSGNTGHFPWPHDFDGDGRDEIVCGYTLLSPDGKKQWEAKLPGHADGVAVGNVDSDPRNTTEIALATCGGNVFVLLNDKGKVLWRHPCGHSQHIIIGDFRPDLPGKEVCGLDRGNDRSASGVDAMVMYSAKGEQLWREKRTDRGRNRWITIITMVENWDGRRGDLILGYRRGGSTPPTLYDGHGKAVATFPFPNPQAVQFAHHADICGDEREEILIWNDKRIWIYKNGAASPESKTPKKRPQTKRLYNYTYYIGMP